MKIIVQNLAIEYQDEGTGPAMLFLHGWQDNLHTFDSLVPLLAPAWRMVRLDLPGFGKSEVPKEDWNLDKYIQFVKDFIQKLNLQVSVLVGHSFGGRIVIKGIATKNLQANKIILIGSAGISKNRKFRKLTLKIIAKVGGLVTYIPPLNFWREKIRKKMYSQIGSDYLEAGALKETFLKIIEEDLGLAAKNITKPTLLIWGSNDMETPLTDGEQLVKLIYGSKLKVINKAGHFVHQEKPQEVAGIIQEFLC